MNETTGRDAQYISLQPFLTRLAAILVLTFTASAIAQDQTDLPTEIEEVVVTAQQREQRTMDVPMSVPVAGQVIENHTTIKPGNLPPWWRTRWAYSLYVVATVLLLFCYLKIRRTNLTRRARLLEKTVEERTARTTLRQQHMQHQAEDLEELLHLKERLITNISHEFRTPLTLILAPAKRMLRRTKDSRDHAHLETIRRNAQRLLRLVDQLLGMARLGADESQASSSQAVATTATAIIDSFQPLAKEKGLQLVLQSSDDLWVFCTPDALEKILLNLLSNAIKFTPVGGQITVSSRLDQNGMVEISVSDTGIGIPEDEHEAVFERFHRVGDSGEKIPGAGIGLALVKESVEAHDGSVMLTSCLGEGTTVTVCLPPCTPVSIEQDTGKQAVSAEAIDLEVESISMPIAGPDTGPINEVEGKASILIAEDNTDLQHYLAELLCDTYQCIVADDGEMALELAFEHIPDLVLLDVSMPKMDGFQVTHALKEDERTSHIPITMLTARHDRDSRMESWHEKVDGYLTKPFDDEELKLRIANLLEIRDILKSRFCTWFFDENESLQISNDRENGFLTRLEDMLERHHSDPEFGLSQMASEVFMSTRQLQRKLKAITGQHPSVFLRSYRLRKGRQLLKRGMQVGMAADAVGFSSPAYFASCFKAQFGQTPSEYR